MRPQKSESAEDGMEVASWMKAGEALAEVWVMGKFLGSESINNAALLVSHYGQHSAHLGLAKRKSCFAHLRVMVS